MDEEEIVLGAQLLGRVLKTLVVLAIAAGCAVGCWLWRRGA
jgi:hypothetical protein